jgi:DNA invertase Pin-like site-specific DNA recombinase
MVKRKGNKIAVGYIRVSTEDQAREGISLENQKKKIELYAELNGLVLEDIIADEGISAKNLNRPGVQRIIEMAKKKQVDCIIIYKLDRMFRNTIDALKTSQMLDKKGIALHSINEKLDTKSAIGRFFFSLMASLAEMERNIISERTTDALRCKKAKGERVGEIPYGYDTVDGNLVPNDEEQTVISLIHEMRNERMSYKAIAQRLSEKQITTKKGLKAWNYQTVRNIVKRHEIYITAR